MMEGDVLRAYLAGFMDGEGSIRIHKSEKFNYRTLVVSVGQNERPVLDIFRQRYGGQVVYRRPSVVKSSGNYRRGSWDWRVAGLLAKAALVDLRPFLIGKAGEADLAIQFQTIKGQWHHRPLSGFEVAERDSFYLALQDLKRAA
jgi:hypothetical protein